MKKTWSVLAFLVLLSPPVSMAVIQILENPGEPGPVQVILMERVR